MTDKPIVAIDARKLVRRKTGVGRYIAGFVRYLPAAAPDFEFHLLVDRPFPPGELPVGCREVVLGDFYRESGKIAKLYSPWWLNVLVPKYLHQMEKVLFHGPNFVIPANTFCPCVTTIHDLAFIKVPHAYDPIYRFYMRSQVKVAVRRAAAVIVGSKTGAADLVEIMKVPKDKVYVVYYGVDKVFKCSDRQQFYDIKRTMNLPERFLLCVGVVERRKNIDILLKAAKPLISEGVVDGVVIAGKDGLGADAVRRLTFELGIEKRVIFLGYIPERLLVGLYNLAQCLVFPSWYEGFGLPVLEAMACGCPVLASNSSSIPEAGGDAALYFSPGDVNGLEQSLRAVLTSRSLREEMIKKGFVWASRFTWEKAAVEHADIYRNVLEKKERRRRDV